MNYCSHCGEKITIEVPAGDSRPRHVCVSCGTVHYQNPRIIVGCVPQWEDKVLLCKRSIEPRYGYWTLPAGFMENGETAHEGAARETLEEANARVEIASLYTLFNLPQINQVYLFFRSRLLDLDFCAGEESLEVELFSEAEIPWEELAFPVIGETLRRYFQDRSAGVFTQHSGSIERVEGRPGRFETVYL